MPVKVRASFVVCPVNAWWLSLWGRTLGSGVRSGLTGGHLAPGRFALRYEGTKLERTVGQCHGRRVTAENALSAYYPTISSPASIAHSMKVGVQSIADTRGGKVRMNAHCGEILIPLAVSRRLISTPRLALGLSWLPARTPGVSSANIGITRLKEDVLDGCKGFDTGRRSKFVSFFSRAVRGR